MALSDATKTKLQEALDAIDAFYERRLGEVDRDVRNLREYGEPLSELGEATTEAATDLAVSTIDTILGTA